MALVDSYLIDGLVDGDFNNSPLVFGFHAKREIKTFRLGFLWRHEVGVLDSFVRRLRNLRRQQVELLVLLGDFVVDSFVVDYFHKVFRDFITFEDLNKVFKGYLEVLLPCGSILVLPVLVQGLEDLGREF